MPPPEVPELERMTAADAKAALVTDLVSAATVESTLMDAVRIEPKPDADFAGDLWLVCRLPDGALDLIAPPYTSKELAELLDARVGEFAVAGWTRPELTCVLLARGYAVRVTMPGEDYVPVARWNLELLGEACTAVAARCYPNVASVPDATGALRQRVADDDDVDGSDADDDQWPPASAGGLLGEGWEEFDDEIG